jgi:hypothetical protein
METAVATSTSGTGDVVGAVGERELGGVQATATSAEISRADAAPEVEADYEGALDEGAQMALGTLLLEETDQCQTPEQAGRLRALWQALQGAVTAEVEVDAVIAGIKQAMAPDQLASIADIALTQNDVEAWMQEHGVAFGAPDRLGAPTGERPTDGEGWAGMANLSEEEREAMRATMQASDGILAGAPGPGGAAGQVGMLTRPLVTMLEERVEGA